jgi:mono/diheme cytochrome c family protein
MLREVSVALMAGTMLVSGIAFAQDAGKVERGKAVFVEQKCKICHSVGGVGNPKGPLDDVIGKLGADEMKQWLVNPKEMAEKAKLARKPPMKSFASLPPADLDALVTYLQTLQKK